MKNLFLVIQFTMILSLQAVAQTVAEPINKYAIDRTLVDGPFIEIMNRQDDSGLININKETGEIWMIWGDEAYEVKIEKSENNEVVEGRINYQIITCKDKNYLLNLNTGETWRLKEKAFSHKNSRFELVKKKR